MIELSIGEKKPQNAGLNQMNLNPMKHFRKDLIGKTRTIIIGTVQNYGSKVVTRRIVSYLFERGYSVT
jgi:hypothetical protein